MHRCLVFVLIAVIMPGLRGEILLNYGKENVSVARKTPIPIHPSIPMAKIHAQTNLKPVMLMKDLKLFTAKSVIMPK
jgi:hypothetical protein